MRAISAVSSSSHNFQPKCSASRRAISAPPLPYSRSTVMVRICMAPSEILVYCDWASRLYFLHQEHEGNYNQDGHREEPEVVNVGEHGRLLIEQIGDHGVGLMRSLIGARPARNKHLRRSCNHCLKTGIPFVDVPGKARLVKLSTAREHGCYKRDSDAAADISGKVDQT